MQLGWVIGLPSPSSFSSPHFVGLMERSSPPVAEALSCGSTGWCGMRSPLRIR